MKHETLNSFITETSMQKNPIGQFFKPDEVSRLGNITTYDGFLIFDSYHVPDAFNIVIYLPEYTSTSFVLFRSLFLTVLGNLLCKSEEMESLEVYGDHLWVDNKSINLCKTKRFDGGFMLYIGIPFQLTNNQETEDIQNIRTTTAKLPSEQREALHSSIHNAFYRILQETFIATQTI